MNVGSEKTLEAKVRLGRLDQVWLSVANGEAEKREAALCRLPSIKTNRIERSVTIGSERLDAEMDALEKEQHI